MSTAVEQFAYLPRDPALGDASLAPMLPLTLIGTRNVEASGLVDSGAAVNVLPYSLGVQLGFDWNKQTTSVALSGNLAAVEARIAVVSALLGDFAPTRLAFAWAKTDEVLLIFGQVNFFLEYDVCFFRARGLFEVRPKHSP